MNKHVYTLSYKKGISDELFAMYNEQAKTCLSAESLPYIWNTIITTTDLRTDVLSTLEDIVAFRTSLSDFISKAQEGFEKTQDEIVQIDNAISNDLINNLKEINSGIEILEVLSLYLGDKTQIKIL